MTDHLSNVLNSLKNGQKAGLKNVLLSGDVPQICIDVLNVLYKEGYIRGFQHVVSNNKKYISVFLKYTRTGQSVIKSITRVSKPGRRIYTSIKPLWKVKTGFGVFILSTPKGIMTDFDARLLNLGGEILCSVA